jgi:transmembrane sensor
MPDDFRQSDLNGQEPDWDAFARFVADESTPADARAMEAWFAAHPADERVAASVKAHAVRAEQSANISVNVDAALASVRARMADSPAVAPAAPALTVVRGNAPKVASIPSAKPAKRWALVSFAAAATFFTAIGVMRWRGSADQGAERVIATRVGQRDSVTLSDGSKVVLAPGSKITVASGFDGGNRQVTLEGAAFFDVQHDAAHPFMVRAAGAEIRDIGTAFSVKTDATGNVSVAVTHGTVAVRQSTGSATSAAVELHAGDRGTLRGADVAVNRGSVNTDDIAWTRGQLTYRDTPLSEVQADLKRWYGLNLQVADSALSKKTVTMSAQPDSAHVISTIALLLGADAELHGDTVIFRLAGRSSTP